jgi:hypothetical protein
MNFDLSFVSSVKEYVDRKIIEKLSAWKVANIPLFEQNDSRLYNYRVLSAGTRQFLYDSEISSSIVSNSGLTNGWQNSKVDFKNSKLIVPKSPSIGSPPAYVTGAYKLYNSYVTSKSDEELFLNTAFLQNPEQITQTEAVKSDSFYSPCYFYKLGNTNNKPWSFGGTDQSIFDFKVTIFAMSESDLLSIGGVIRDLNNTNCYLLNSTPLNEYNDLKSKPWGFYQKMGEMKALGQPKISFDKTSFYPIKSDAIKSKIPNSFIGVANIRAFVCRNPRSN